MAKKDSDKKKAGSTSPKTRKVSEGTPSPNPSSVTKEELAEALKVPSGLSIRKTLHTAPPTGTVMLVDKPLWKEKETAKLEIPIPRELSLRLSKLLPRGTKTPLFVSLAEQVADLLEGHEHPNLVIGGIIDKVLKVKGDFSQ